MSFSRRFARVRLGVLAFTAALLLVAGVGSALARPAERGAHDGLREWLGRAVRALARRQDVRSEAMFAEVVAYGPIQATTPTGTSTTRVETFSLSAAPSGQRYQLKVENGSSTGTLRATSGSVVLNGATVVTSAELTAIGTGASLRKPIFIKTTVSNTLSATVAGVAGSYVTLSVVAASDSTFTLFSKTYQRASGQAVTVTDQFTLPAGAGLPRYLYVTNGNGDGTATSSSATVTLNGVEVVGSTNLSGTVQGFVVPVTLQQTNTVATKLMGSTGSKLTLRFAATDSAKPVLTVTAPAPGLVTKLTSVTATGTVSDQTAVGVTVTAPGQSVAATLTTNSGVTSYSAPINLTEGSNAITIRAVDGAGNTTDSTRTVIRDTQAPTVQITSLADTAIYTADSTAVVAGTILDATRVTANLNGAAVPIDSVTHAFSRTVALAQGANFLTLVATDAAGNATTVVRQVTRNASAPTLTVTAPTDSLYTTAATVHVAGTASAAIPMTVKVQGTAVVLANGAFQADVPLSAGSNTITVVATTAAGVQTTRTRTVIRDNQPPVAAFASPAAGLVTKADSIAVGFTFSDASPISAVAIGGGALSPPFASPITRSYALAEGPTTITVTVQDAAGNATTITRDVVRDATPPTLTLTAPAAGAVTGTATYRVTGTVTDATALTLTVNDVATAIAADGSYGADITLSTGANAVTVVATDAAGNASTRTGSVLFDAAPPTLTLTSPTAALTVTGAATYVVTGTAADQTGASVTVNDVPVTLDGAGGFSVPVTLASGTNTITIVATDGAGNQSTVQRQVDLDTQAPALAVTSPLDGATTQAGSVAVSGTATDAHVVTVSVNGAALAVGAGGAFSGTVALNEGPNTVAIVARDEAGNEASVTRTVTRTSATAPAGFAEKVPVDPSLGAPAPAAGVLSSVAGSMDFLYKGPNAVQHDVAAGAIANFRAAVVRGRLLTRDGLPLSGVTVKVAGQPKLGWTTSRANGLYDMAVAGGGKLTLTYTKTGYFPVTRDVTTTWSEFTPMDDVVLTAADTAATAIAFAAPIEAARASTVQDASGTRRATLLFRQGTQVTLVLPSGATQAVTGGVTVRATEYTVGDRGPDAMPATLPATTGYTYAAEFSLDEAIQAGATEVRFSKPVTSYTENFLGFPVGMLVPSGYYDRVANEWKPSPNGRVIRVLSVDGGSAAVDVRGTGTATTADTLAALGIDAPELAQLAQLYQPGQTLWRVPLTHFSPSDFNWSWGVGRYADSPSLPPDRDADDPLDPDPDTQFPGCKQGSEINVQDRILGESFALANTPFFLHYSTDRTPGYAASRTISVPLIGASIPVGIQKVRLDIEVAGRRLQREFTPSANLTYQYTWDGIDAYGRRLNGPQPITARVSYYYFGIYLPPVPYEQMFGAFPTVAAKLDSVIPSRQLVYKATEYKGYVGTWDARLQGLGAWTLSEHHVYDPIGKVLYKGDGSKIDAAPIGDVVRVFAGVIQYGHLGDGGPATSAQITEGGKMAALPDGSLVFGDQIQIRKVDSTGIISTLSPAINQGMFGVVAGPDGSLYYATANEREWRRKPDGTTTVIAGGGFANFAEGVGAFEVRDYAPQYTARAVGPDGALYLGGGGVIWRLGKDNRFHRAVGNPTPNCTTPVIEGPALALDLCKGITAFTVGPDNSIYFVETNTTWIIRVGPDGMATKVTGGPASTSAFDDGPAINAQVWGAASLSVAPDGSLIILVGSRVRKIEPNGFIHTIIGNANAPCCNIKDGELAKTAQMWYVTSAIAGPDGSIYIMSGGGDARVFRVAPALPGLKLGEFYIPSPDGGELYIFGVDGRHSRTRNATTMHDIYRFAYDSTGRLLSITDAVGLVTTIAPGATGSSTEITSARGVKTVVQMDANGFASRLQGPQGYGVTPTHDATGLLRALRDERGLPHRFEYDSLGKLTLDADTLGTQSLLGYVTGRKSIVTHTSAAGEATMYTVESASDGTITQSTLRAGQRPDSTIIGKNGTRELRLSGNTRGISTQAPDPRFGMPVPFSSISSYRTGLGINSAITRSRRKVGGSADPMVPSGVLLDSTRVNGRLYIDTLDLTGRRWVSTSPQGRRSAAQFDARGKITASQRWSRAATAVTYDSLGQITSVQEGGLIDSIEWNALGFARRTRRADGSEVIYDRDSLGQVLTFSVDGAPGGTFLYDPAGNLTTATVPGNRRYTFTYDAQGRVTADSLASNGLLLGSYAYDGAGHLRSVRRPGRLALSFDYDASGRLKFAGNTRVGATLGYDPATDQLATLAGGGQTYTMQYDGLALTKITAAGLVAGGVEYAYNAEGWARQIKITGRPGVDYAFDGDGLTTRAGALTLTRDAVTGDITGDTIGVLGVSRTYDDHGRLRRYELRVAGQPRVARSLERDSLGRIITQRDSSVAGVTTTTYHFDGRDRLDQVSRNGILLQQFEYDTTGNRLGLTTTAGTLRATYADDDRILSIGADAITHDSSGARLTERLGADSLIYAHDDLGRLTSVSSVSRGVLTFKLDAAGRRVQELKNGTVARKFLYGASLMPTAELDANGVVKSEFVYASGSTAPDYLLQGGRTIYLLRDQLGSVQMAIDASTGEVLQELEFDAAGVALRNTNLTLQPFTYAGGLSDLDARFVHFGARDYDPRTGRWLQADPIGARGGSNRYSYAANDPIDYSDPTGLRIECKTAAACDVWNSIVKQAQAAANSDDAATRAAGLRLLGVLSDLYYAPEVISLTVGNGKMLDRLSSTANASAPCIRTDQWCSPNSSYAARVDPSWDGLITYDVGVNTRMVHELGHIWNALKKCRKFKTRENDQGAVDVEDDYRKIRGCGERSSHPLAGGACS